MIQFNSYEGSFSIEDTTKGNVHYFPKGTSIVIASEDAGTVEIKTTASRKVVYSIPVAGTEYADADALIQYLKTII